MTGEPARCTTFVAAAALLALAPPPAGIAGQPPDASPVTRWEVQSSLGLDAVLFVGALSGDRLQREHYEAPLRRFRERLEAPVPAALERVADSFAATGSLVGPTLALVFSAGPCDTFDDILASARRPDERLRPALEASPYWDDAARWEAIRDAVLPDVLTVLLGLRDAGFEAYWRDMVETEIAARAAGMQRYLERFDVIAEQQRLLGRPLDRKIEVLLMHFNRPYGIKIIGQRFLSHHSFDMETQLHIAAHEIFHPPFDTGDASLFDSLEPLRSDPWMRSIVEDHDPSFGYNSFEGVLNEDSTQALDQIVSERLGVAREPAERWRSDDDGMHMLAAAIYHMLREDDFARTGGDYPAWLDSAIERGLFAPAEVRRRAAEIVGREAVDKWAPIPDAPHCSSHYLPARDRCSGVMCRSPANAETGRPGMRSSAAAVSSSHEPLARREFLHVSSFRRYRSPQANKPEHRVAVNTKQARRNARAIGGRAGCASRKRGFRKRRKVWRSGSR